MATKTEKTNAMRILEARGIHYVAHRFPPEIHSAEQVAETLRVPPEIVFKTLVVISDKGRPLLAIVPGSRELDLKRLARASGEKSLRMASQREAERLTGLLVGGISALALLSKGFRVFLDASASAHEQVLVSAGQRGINLQLAPADLLSVTGAIVDELVR